MRIRKPLGAAAAIGLSLATFVVMGTAGAQTSSTSSTSSSTTTTSIAEPTDQAATVSLTCTGEGLTDPVSVDVDFTTTVPSLATEGSVFPVDISGVIAIDTSAFPPGVTITTIDVENLDMKVSASGGGTMTPDPVGMAPTSFTITISPPNSPPVGGSASIEVTDETTPIILSVQSPVTLTMTAHLDVNGNDVPVTIDLSCSVGNADIAAINGEVPPTTTTTAPATTTTAVAASTTPRYTG